ncbi:tRNA(Ile)(2)-agmatinylcytidine synthase [Halomarina litorea]|uniref:tRNA(Ile)(2)-agmatinylcytidine synthase n=1 Tax=Halomarina litorea TaxID=2961595 RepID=UPI0020C29A30|nr:tRNA(Ile)(2)-agmatinylcytidine synthase [Halomarina sp. BCD28]
MTVIGLDDTDSRETGMCTTYAAHLVAERLREAGAAVERLLLVRLNPAVEHKTRGNAALAVHTDAPVATAFAAARAVVEEHAETDDERTNPGLVVLPDDPDATVGPRDALARFARAAVREQLTVADAEALLALTGGESEGWGNGRGRIGAIAAVGAWAAFDEWTYEHIAYREPSRWGTPREVDADSLFEAADSAYPTVWDTVDRGTGETVAVPHTPGPVLFGIRGDDRAAVERVAAAIDAEPVAASETFVTNQGTDVHLGDGTVEGVLDGRAYRVTGEVVAPPETRRGGHVFVPLAGEGATLQLAAFEPTKRFRDRVRALRPGDRVTACGEFSASTAGADAGADADSLRGTLKLEKFAVRSLDTTERVTPTCPDCDRRMESAGRGQGYRCRDCGTSADGKVERAVDRAIEPGWYEVPPRARRHVARPLVRGGFDAPTHPER